MALPTIDTNRSSHVGTAECNSSFARQELKAARRTAFLVGRVLLRVLRAEGRETFAVQRALMRNPRERLRLGIWQVWATRHKVPVSYVIQTLLHYWREKTRRPGKKTSALGVTFATLTSAKSEPILASAIERDFPGRENESQWQMQARLRLLGLDELRGHGRGLVEMLFSKDSLDESCNIYQNRIERRQKRLDKAAAAHWRRRRTWRGNPWL